MSIFLFSASIVALGAIVSAKPLDELGYKGWGQGQRSFNSPYTSSVYLGWAIASAIALLATGILPMVSWFATYRFTLSSAISIAVFTSTHSPFYVVVYTAFNSLPLECHCI